MAHLVDGIVVAKNNTGICVAADENSDGVWFNFATDFADGDEDEAEFFEVLDDVEFHVTDACAKKKNLK